MINFDINASQVQALVDMLGASEAQYRAAFSRALQRTAATLRKMSGRGLKQELQLRALGTLRNRLKTIKLRRNSAGDGVQLWYGLNDMPVSSFKGRPRNTEKGAQKNGHEIEGGFVGKTSKGKTTIFKRAGRARLPIREQLMPIKDKADVYIEDEIFINVEDIFWRHFEQDIKRRVKYVVTSDRWAQ